LHTGSRQRKYLPEKAQIGLISNMYTSDSNSQQNV
jgi:hypothetical protein